MSEGDCVQAATVNRRAKSTRHSNPDVGLFMERGDGSDAAAFIADIIRSSGSWEVELGAGKGTGTAGSRPASGRWADDIQRRDKRCC